MLPEEYVRTYFVSDAYSINLDGKIIAVLLSCEQCDCVFLENLSYDTEYCKYSVGFQIYVFFLQQMIKKGKKQVYTGEGTMIIKNDLIVLKTLHMMDIFIGQHWENCKALW